MLFDKRSTRFFELGSRTCRSRRDPLGGPIVGVQIAERLWCRGKRPRHRVRCRLRDAAIWAYSEHRPRSDKAKPQPWNRTRDRIATIATIIQAYETPKADYRLWRWWHHARSGQRSAASPAPAD